MRKHASPRSKWRSALGALPVTCIALAVYLRTAAPGLTWEHYGADGGDLIAASMSWGVPHPSGYPTYILLSRLWAWLLPITPIARRFNLFSCVCAAISAGLAYLWIQRLLAKEDAEPALADISAAGAALVWALGPALWQQAVITEVYAPQMMSTAAILLTTSLIAERPSAQSWLWALCGLLMSLGLGMHLTTALLWPGIALVMWPRLGRTKLLALGGGLALGACVFLYLPLAARQSPPVNWGDASTWAGFRWLVSGRLYRGYLLELPISAYPGRLAAWAAMWRKQLTAVGVLLAGGGLAALSEWHSSWLRATLVCAGLFSFLAIAYDTADSHVYLLTAFMMGSLWLAAGACWLGQWVTEQSWISRRPSGQRRWVAKISAAMVLGGICVWLVMVGMPAHDLSMDAQATRWVDATLGHLPPNAILITSQDRHTFAMDYTQWAEGARRDVIVIDGDLTHFNWYRDQLASRYPDIDLFAKDDDWRSWLASQSSERALYAASPRPDLDGLFLGSQEGEMLRLSPAP